jgi:hypothetical protein
MRRAHQNVSVIPRYCFRHDYSQDTEAEAGGKIVIVMMSSNKGFGSSNGAVSASTADSCKQQLAGTTSMTWDEDYSPPSSLAGRQGRASDDDREESTKSCIEPVTQAFLSWSDCCTVCN